MSAPADLVLANARVLTLDYQRPRAEAVAVRAGRIIAVGAWADLRPLVGPATEVVDAEGGVALPAFHDAHLHLLGYARTHSRLDCREARSIGDLQALLAARAHGLPAGAWLRAWGHDEARLREARQPDRHDLDRAVPDRPVRLRHRSLHLDMLNTAALRALALLDDPAPNVERDPTDGEPTGRLYHAGDLLRARLPRPSEDELAADVRRASERLLAWGVTTVQDASHTNGPEEWALFHRLAARDALCVRLFFMPGAQHWQHMLTCASPPLPLGEGRGEGDGALASHESDASGLRPALTPERPILEAFRLSQGEREQHGAPPRVFLGPVKLMLDEGTTDPAAVRVTVAAVHAAGGAVALHAVSEAEVAIALDARPNRIEHGAVIPDAWLDALRRARVMVVGQPALVYERGDAYRAAYPPELHGWLHRAGSLLRAGVAYAAGSDAPVTEPAPGLALYAARRRRTRDGAVLGPDETLRLTQALAALTLGPARAVGAAHLLGRLRPGMLGDVVVVDRELLADRSVETALRPARLTIMAGRVVWRREEGDSWSAARASA